MGSQPDFPRHMLPWYIISLKSLQFKSIQIIQFNSIQINSNQSIQINSNHSIQIIHFKSNHSAQFIQTIQFIQIILKYSRTSEIRISEIRTPP